MAATALLAAKARAEFPLAADASRCDTSGNPPGCISLPNEMSGAAGSCNGNKWKYASTNFCATDPLILASPNELLGVTGLSIDVSWRRTGPHLRSQP